MASSGDCVKNISKALWVPHPGHSIPNHFLLGQGIIQEESSILLMIQNFNLVLVANSPEKSKWCSKIPNSSQNQSLFIFEMLTIIVEKTICAL